MDSPGGNNINPPPTINHSLPHGVSNMQEALANVDREKKNAPQPGGRRKRRRKSRRKSKRKSKRKSRRKRKSHRKRGGRRKSRRKSRK